MKCFILIISFLYFASFDTAAQSVHKRLYRAVLAGDTTEMKKLINQGADVNTVIGEGPMKLSLLSMAVNTDKKYPLKILLENGADVNWIDGFNTTPLMYAADKGNIEMATLLLRHGADITHKDAQGVDALTAARKKKHKQMVKLLEAQLQN